MLRPPSVHCLERLLAAREWPDRDLDRALSDVGVLPPADLAPIRELLNLFGASLATRRNPDGHAIVEVRCGPALHGSIHPDGHVELAASAVG